MLKTNVESDRFEPLFSSGWQADPKKNSRLGYVLVGAFLAHVALLKHPHDQRSLHEQSRSVKRSGPSAA